MGQRLNDRIWALSVNVQEKTLLLAMATYANDDGTNCCPAVASLARLTSLSQRSVELMIDRLTAAGFVLDTHRVSQRYRTKYYELTPEKGDPKILAAKRLERSEYLRRKGKERKLKVGEHCSPMGRSSNANSVRGEGERGDVARANANARIGEHCSPDFKDLPKPLSKNLPASGARLSPRSSTERWSKVHHLAGEAERIWISSSSKIPDYGEADWAEDLKRYAAWKRINYSDRLSGANSIIAQAIEVARARLRDKRGRVAEAS
jgi:DNA-binding transcriptional ArsR family regulator